MLKCSVAGTAVDADKDIDECELSIAAVVLPTAELECEASSAT